MTILFFSGQLLFSQYIKYKLQGSLFIQFLLLCLKEKISLSK